MAQEYDWNQQIQTQLAKRVVVEGSEIAERETVFMTKGTQFSSMDENTWREIWTTVKERLKLHPGRSHNDRIQGDLVRGEPRHMARSPGT